MKSISSKTKLSRRAFVVGTTGAAARIMLLEAAAGQWHVPIGELTVSDARTEMGQGTRTGLAQLVAEELECDWKKVTTDSITPGQNLARKRVWGEMGTGGSRGIRTSHDYVRRGDADHAGVVGFDDYPCIDLDPFIRGCSPGTRGIGRHVKAERQPTTGSSGGTDHKCAAGELRLARNAFHGRPPQPQAL
jgi:hypothetical protein